jgi:hypothetical protein
LTELTTSALQRLYRSAHSRLKEDFASQTADVVQRETARLLDLEATKLLAQCTLIINGNASPTDKLGELCSLLLTFDDPSDDEDEDATGVNVHPTARG